jgi:hypothetical protein
MALDTDIFKNLTKEERLKVDLYAARSPTDIPRYFNAGTQSFGQEPDQPISREFEAYLILQALKDPEKLSDAMRWFTEAADLQIKRDDRDALLDDAFEKERTDSLKVLQESSERTLRFARFREGFEIVEVEESTDSLTIPPSRFADIPEISLIMRDSQLAMGEIASKQSRAEHLVVEDAVLDEQQNVRETLEDSIGGIADPLIAQELLSWRDVIIQIQTRVSSGLNPREQFLSGGANG